MFSPAYQRIRVRLALAARARKNPPKRSAADLQAIIAASDVKPVRYPPGSGLSPSWLDLEELDQGTGLVEKLRENQERAIRE